MKILAMSLLATTLVTTAAFADTQQNPASNPAANRAPNAAAPAMNDQQQPQSPAVAANAQNNNPTQNNQMGNPDQMTQ